MKDIMKRNTVPFFIWLILFLWLCIECIKYFYDVQSGMAIIYRDPLLFYYHLIGDTSLYNLQILAPLFVISASIYNFHRKLHSGMIVNYLTRIEYKRFFTKEYLYGLLKSMVLPIFVVLLLVLSCIVTRNINFGSDENLYGWLFSPDPKYLSNIGAFIITYVIVIILHSILYYNISLICCKKNSNFIVTVVLSFLIFIGIDIFFETFLGGLFLTRLLGINNITDSLNLFNIWVYDNVISLSFVIVYSLLLVLISFVFVVINYKDKEGVLNEIKI